MTPPRPNFSGMLDTSNPGQLHGLNIYQRIEAKLDHIIDCLHAADNASGSCFMPANCPECFWSLKDGACPHCSTRAPEAQEVS